MTLIEAIQDEEIMKSLRTRALDRCEDSVLAEEAVGTVTARAAKYPNKTFASRDEARNYVSRALRNACLDLLEQRATQLLMRTSIDDPNVPEPVDQSPLPDAGLVTRDVQRALAQLTPQERYVAELFMIDRTIRDGFTTQVAEELGIHPKSVWAIQQRAMSKLKVLLADYAVEESGRTSHEIDRAS